MCFCIISRMKIRRKKENIEKVGRNSIWPCLACMAEPLLRSIYGLGAAGATAEPHTNGFRRITHPHTTPRYGRSRSGPVQSGPNQTGPLWSSPVQSGLVRSGPVRRCVVVTIVSLFRVPFCPPLCLCDLVFVFPSLNLSAVVSL